MRELKATPEDVLHLVDVDELPLSTRHLKQDRRPNTHPECPADRVPLDGRERDPQDRYYDS
jgi:hypothetical protein